MAARDEAANIADNAQRLARVRAELFRADTHTIGGALAAQRELAARLEQAGRQLAGALYDANKRIDEKDAKRIDADRDREIAERLKDKAYAVREARAEARLAALPRYRRMQTRGDQDQ